MVGSFTTYRRVLSAVLLLTVGAVQADSCATSCSTSCATSCPTVKCYSRRSDSRHLDRLMSGQVHYMNRYESESWYGLFSVTPGYSRTFRSDKIAKCLFGADVDCSDCPTIHVQGTGVENRRSDAWLADYFYLPRNYDGKFTVDPTIGTFHLDLDLYVGLDEWCGGLYFHTWGTVVHSKWDLNFCDSPGFSGNTALDHPHGYFSPANYEGSALVQSFAAYANGGIPTDSSNNPFSAPEANNRDISFTGLKFCKISACDRTQTGFADLRAELGWNFLNCEDYHLGVNIQFAAPTGSKKDSCFLFDAQVGNGDHWELGGGLSGHYQFWCNEDGDSSISFHLNAAVTHLFDKCQRRCFDLCNRPNSAYMLAAKFGPNGDENPPNDQVGFASTIGAATADQTAASRQFAFNYQPVANLTAVRVDVSVGAQADVVAMFNYLCGNWSWDLGYNFWARSCEKIDCVKSCNDGSICDTTQKDTWALKGDARMFGYEDIATTINTPDDTRPVPLSATQCAATIHSGTNKVAPASVATVVPANASAVDINANVDGAQFAYELANNNELINIPLEAARVGVHIIKTSSTPKFLACSDLDLARLRGLSHTIFSHLSYRCDWEESCWNPYFGIGVSAEFGTHDESCCDTTTTTNVCSTNCCASCIDCAVSEWSVWFKGGVTFS